jgi:hypothetical protein
MLTYVFCFNITLVFVQDKYNISMGYFSAHDITKSDYENLV